MKVASQTCTVEYSRVQYSVKVATQTLEAFCQRRGSEVRRNSDDLERRNSQGNVQR